MKKITYTSINANTEPRYKQVDIGSLKIGSFAQCIAGDSNVDVTESNFDKMTSGFVKVLITSQDKETTTVFKFNKILNDETIDTFPKYTNVIPLDYELTLIPRFA